MKVILLEDIKGHGQAGEVVDVSPGYARNYLLPRGLAEEATKQNIARAQSRQRAEEAKREQGLQEAEKLKEALSGLTVTLKAKSGESGRLFGSITTQEIADGLKEQHGIEIDRRKIELDEPIKDLGVLDINVRIFPEVVGQFKVSVEAE